jgi:hypothetical protein
MQSDYRSIKEHLAKRLFTNKKPYRTAAQKAEARCLARVVDGHWVSSAAVSFHNERRPRD